jgi:choline dehydrogenase
VTRIVFDRRRTNSVEFRFQGKTIRAGATQEIILPLGAIHTPKVVMQSGIGDETELQRIGISVLQALPGVGRNLHNHVAFGWNRGNTNRALPDTPRSQTACFWKTGPELEAPNFFAFAKQGAFITRMTFLHRSQFNRTSLRQAKGALLQSAPFPFFGAKLDENLK